MVDEPEHPALYLKQQFMFLWSPHDTNGCHCVCRMYHYGSGICRTVAEPSRLLRVIKLPHPEGAPGDITDALPVCAPCYDAIAPLAE